MFIGKALPELLFRGILASHAMERTDPTAS
jgi:hypothetical protein